MKQILQTDPVFSNLTIPLSEKEQEKLERSLLMEGCLEPVTVWDGVILDGHKRYEFCSYEEIPFEVVEIDFADQKDALIWVCEQRMHDAPKKKLIYKYLVGTWCLIMKPIYSDKYRKTAGMQYRDDSGRFRVSKMLAEELGIAYSMAERSCTYAAAFDRIAAYDQKMLKVILSETVYVSYNDILKLGKQDLKTINAVRKKIREKHGRKRRRRRKSLKEDENNEIPLAVGIKDMPEFDPDMEIRGLAFTIPTWMAAIARAEKRTDMALATDEAKERLSIQLRRLESQIHETLEAIK